MNLLEQQAANRRRTWLVMTLFVLVLVAAGSGLDLFVLGGNAPIGTLAALALGTGSAWFTLRHGDQAILASAQAEPVAGALAAAPTEDDRLRYQQFQNIVEEVAIAAGLPAPAAYVIPDADANAFATGRDPAHASIAVTEGLLRTLNREELQGVVAHEMGHVRNYDIRLMMVVSALLGAVVLIAEWSGRSLGFRGGRARRDGRSGGASMLVFLVIWMVAIVVAPIVTRLLSMWVSRTREYLADASGAELTRNPLALASALRKIEAASAPTEAIKAGAAALCIADPAARAVNEREGRWADLWATHPPMAKRIAALTAMAYQGAASR